MIAEVERDRWLARAAESAGTPVYVYFAAPIAERIAAVEREFGGRFEPSFAVKANPNPALLGWMRGRVPGLDVSSIGELRLASAAGWDPADLSFTGPGKRDFELEAAIAGGLGALVLESIEEARRAAAIARRLGRVQQVLVRLSPARVPRGFGDQMAGRPSPFGIDVEAVDAALPEILALGGLQLVGLHIYSGTQALRAEAVVENWRLFAETFRAVAEAHALAPAKLVFGAGLGIPYHPGDQPIDLAAVAAGIGPTLDALRAEPRFRGARFGLELGRYLVGEAGFFVTRVVGVKDSRGTRIVICDGGMNHHLPASGHFGMVVPRNYRMHRVGGGEGEEAVNLVGPLCTSIDRLGTGVVLPRLAAGDLVAVHSSGAYGLTASPLHFISHPAPREVLVDGGRMLDVSLSARGQIVSI